MAAIRAGLAANLAAAFPTVNVSAYMFASPDPPCIDLMPGGASFDLAMDRGVDSVQLVVRVMVSWADVVAAQENLDAYMATTGPLSVKKAVESDGTLGGVVAWTRVQSVSGYKEYPHKPAQVADVQTKLGVEFTVLVYT